MGEGEEADQEEEKAGAWDQGFVFRYFLLKSATRFL